MSASLAAIPFLRDVPEALLRPHESRAVWLTVEPGRLILDFDDVSEDLFFVVTGSVRVAVRTPGGRELILDDVRAGGFFGDMAAIDGAPRSASVTALHRSRIGRLSAGAFLALLADSAVLSRRMMQVLTARIREANARMLELASLDTRRRLRRRAWWPCRSPSSQPSPEGWAPAKRHDARHCAGSSGGGNASAMDSRGAASRAVHGRLRHLPLPLIASPRLPPAPPAAAHRARAARRAPGHSPRRAPARAPARRASHPHPSRAARCSRRAIELPVDATRAGMRLPRQV